MTDCISHLGFGFLSRQAVLGNFDGGDLSSDGGLMLLAQADQALGLTAQMAARLADPRQAGKVRHSLHDLLRQRVYQIAAGYEDCNDADRLRGDPILKVAAGRRPESDADLASQPTLSRWENSVGRRELYRLAHVFLDLFVARHQAAPPKRIILDLDVTDDETHGTQELLAFLLRPGNFPAGRTAVAVLKRLQARLQQAWPTHGRTRSTVLGLDYQALDERYAVAEFTYRVRRGHLQRMVVIREKLEPDERDKKQLRLLEAPGYAYQIIATNAPESWSGTAVWRFYNHRSCLENIIKECKQDFGGDHILSSCWEGNRLWLALSVLAYNLWNWFREKILDQRAHRRRAQWLRKMLIEIPAYVTRGGRRIFLNLWRGSPGWELYQTAQARLAVFLL